jgi:hypothetical protein
VRIGQGLKEDAVNHAENGCRPPDAKYQRQGGYGGEAPIAAFSPATRPASLTPRSGTNRQLQERISVAVPNAPLKSCADLATFVPGTMVVLGASLIAQKEEVNGCNACRAIPWSQAY